VPHNASNATRGSSKAVPHARGGRSNFGGEIAVFIPCLNEESTIGRVVADFRRELPRARVTVVDNASTDLTVAAALRAGATVFSEKRRGKGYTVQASFQSSEADVVVLVDGDDTYPAALVHDLVGPILSDEADMVVGSRTMRGSTSRFRALNRIGNLIYQGMINLIFGTRLTDILSGYRAMSGKLVRSLPIFPTGFEVEAELTIKTLERGFRILEVPVTLTPRPEGSYSKIRIVQDGMRILLTILALFRDYKPLTFFGGLGLILMLAGSVPGLAAASTFARSGALEISGGFLLGALMGLTGAFFVVIGLILHAIRRRFQELEYYLRLLINR
jgi:glycosyltransferase involved in cell wall biosynthesis